MNLAIGVQSLQTARASAALPGAGAWDATPLALFTSGAQRLTITFTYTRGAAGGAFDWQMETSAYSIDASAPAGAGVWATMSIYAAGALVAGADLQSRQQDELVTYTPDAAAIHSLVYGPTDVSGVERIRVRARESGNVANPGLLAVNVNLA